MHPTDHLTRRQLMLGGSALLLPGLAMNTSPTDYWPFGALQLVQFNGKEFEPIGQSIAVR